MAAVNPALAAQEAAWSYERAQRRARLARWAARLTRSTRQLLELAEIPPACPIHGRHSAGLQRVPITQIRGTEGRGQDFDRDFNPLRAHNRERWKSIFLAWEKGIELPPAELIQVGEVYYVRDGHHRISVAKTFGQKEIWAEVTAWDVKQACSCDISQLIEEMAADGQLQAANGGQQSTDRRPQ
jgi:hypothetical protein